jgi:hypothetical protein
MLLSKLEPRTNEAAMALGFYELGDISDPEKWWEAMQRDERTFWWFPAEAVTADESPEGRAWDHRHSKVRPLSLETRLVWALTVGQAQAMRKEAEAYSAATRGLFRHKLAQMGFYDPQDVELALRAFLEGKRVDVERKLNAPSRLLVDGKPVAENVIALDMRLTPFADADGHAREIVHGSHPGVV